MVTTSFDPDRLVIFRGGFSARWVVVERLLAIEARGARFIPMPGGAFDVQPRDIVTDDDIAFFRLHRAEARAVLAHQADDAHLLLR